MPLLTNQSSRLLGGRGGLATPVPILGAAVNANPTFDTDTGWSKGAGWTINLVATHTGSSSTLSQSSALTSGVWYQVVWTVTSYTSGTPFIRIGTSGNTGKARGAAGTFVDTARADAATAGISGVGDYVVDNVYFYPITLASMFSVKEYGLSTADASVAVTVAVGALAGVVLRWTAADTWLIAVTNGIDCQLIQQVAGTQTVLKTGTPTYVAGARVRATVNGTTAKLYYNGTQVSTDATISASLTGTQYGYFNTYAGNVLSGLTVA